VKVTELDKGDKQTAAKDVPPDAGLHLTKEELSALTKSAHLDTTLFDLAQHSLSERSKLTGESTSQDNVYHELNRIMKLNNYSPANLAQKHNISDKDLPRGWNAVKSHQDFKIYDASDSGSCTQDAAAMRDKLRQQIEAETTTVPVAKGEGYYQVWARMHPELTPDKINEDAHRIKHINGDRDVLNVGERLATATPEERERELEMRLQQALAACQVPPEGKPAAPGTPKVPGKTEPNHPHGDTPGGRDKNHPGGPEKQKPEGDPNKKPEVAPKVPPAGAPGSHPGDGGPSSGGPPGGDNGGRPKDTKAPPTVPAGPDLQSIYNGVLNEHQRAAQSQKDTEQGQGIIGKAFDAAKNNIGTSGAGHSWYDPRAIWSNVFDSDLGSKAVDKRIHDEDARLAELKQAADAHDLNKFSTVYQQLTGKPLDSSGNIAQVDGQSAAAAFDQSQHNGVDSITDLGTAIAVAASLRCGKAGSVVNDLLRGEGTGLLVGGVTKAGLMQVDGHYANLKKDLASGSVIGLSVPIAELGSSQLSRVAGKKFGMTVTGDMFTAKIETQGAGIGTKLLSSALKAGTSGAIYGAVESPGRLAVNDADSGREIHVSDLAAASVKGGVFGFIGGTALGVTVDGVANGFKSLNPKPISTAGTTINGVEVTGSGAVSMGDAAKIMNVDEAEFAQTAAKDPYGTVGKAVQLFEKHGLNIQKSDPLTGDSVLPQNFADALNTVQNVDLLTSDAKMALGSKVKVVQTTDEFLKTNNTAVDNSLSRLENDPNYKQVVQLKTEHGGQAEADAFEKNFRAGFEKDLKTSMAVRQVKGESAKPEDALQTSQPQVEAAYKQKAADYFKDMTDPAQRQRLNSLVDNIYEKFNPQTVSKADFANILDAVPKEDRDLAVALLHESAGNSSDVLMRARFQALKGEISNAVGSSSPNNVYTLTADSSANLLGYLYRKSNSMSMDMRNIDKLISDINSGHVPSSVVLFDDLSTTSISPAARLALSKVPKVYAVDMGSFEKGINIIDVSEGPQAVATKLNTLLAEARTVRAANPGMLPTGVARQTLEQDVTRAAASIGQNVKILRPPTNILAPNASTSGVLAKMDDVDAIDAEYNTPKATKDQIAQFLSGYVGEEREMAARMLADGAVHNSFPVMVQKAVKLHQQLTNALNDSGVKMKDLFVVTDKDPGGSTHLVSYLFGKVNGLAPDHFISTQNLNRLIASGAVKDKAIAYLDDTIYSGQQTTSMLENNISSLMPFKKVVVASLGAYNKGIKSIEGTHLAKIGKVQVTSSGMHQPFYSDAHPFYGQLAGAQRNMVKSIGGSEGFGGVQGSLIWSYMYPDNNLTFFGPSFAGHVLHLPGP
jgi:hypothetical protein